MGPFRCKSKDQRSTEEVKADLMKAAQKHFALQGYQGASLSLIAKEAKVANSLINYYYKGKEGLFMALIETCAAQRLPAIQRFLEEPRSREEIPVRIEMFAQEMLESYFENLDAFEIIQREGRAGNPLVKEVFEKYMLKNFMGVVGFFKTCQDKGWLKADLDPFIVSQLMFNSICEIARNDFLSNAFFGKTIKDPEHRKTIIKHILTLFLTGVMI